MGLRAELVEQIEQKTGTEHRSVKRDELSAPTIHKVYTQITGNQPVPMKGRSWHIRKTFDELGIKSRKDLYRNGIRVPCEELKKIKEHI